MNLRDNNISLNDLLDLIEQYFDCTLSDDDENRLRDIVAHTRLSHPAIDEARALMGFRQPTATSVKEVVTAHRKVDWYSLSGIAAAVAIVIIVVGAMFFVGNGMRTYGGDNQCIAYVNGEHITDEEDVIRLLTDDLREFNDAVEESNNSLLDDLGDIAPVIDDRFPEI